MAVTGPTTQLPGHRDLAPLGRGGYSEVYRAYQEQFDRWVAVKILTFTLTDERSQRRFLRECRLAGRLSSHPNIVTVYDAGISPDGRPYISMELFPEGSISDVLRNRGAFDVADALRSGIALAGALETAHRAGVVHRDVKPGNVLLASYGQPVLTDFGLSIVAEHHEVSVASDALTPYHAAPEVLERTSVTPTSDVYSLASTVYAMLAGRAAHQSEGHDSIASLLLRILQQDVPPLTRPGLPPSLPATLQLAMSRDPAVRTPTATTFALALQDAQRELGIEVTEPVVMDIPASSADIPLDPPGASPSASPSVPGAIVTTPPSPGGPGTPTDASVPPAAAAPPGSSDTAEASEPDPSTSGPWTPAPAPLWDPTSAASPLPSPSPSAQAPTQHPDPQGQPPAQYPDGQAHAAAPYPGTPATPGQDADPQTQPPGQYADPHANASAAPFADPQAQPPAPFADPQAGASAPPFPPMSGDLSAPSPTPPSAGSADVTIQRARLGMPAATDPAVPPADDSGRAGGPADASADPPAASFFTSQQQFGQTGADVGEHTVHRDQLRRPPTQAPLSVPPARRRSRWPLVLLGLLLIGGLAAGAAVLFLNGDDGGGGGSERSDREGPGSEPDAGLHVPEGLEAVESPAGVQLDWQGDEDSQYVVLVLSENADPALREADSPSTLIPATELRPDVGYCFAVADAQDVATAANVADAFSPPSCIRGADESSVRH